MHNKMKLKRILFVAVAALLAGVVSAPAQLSIGPRIGTEVNSLNLDKTVFDNANRAGLTAGLMLEYIAPALNLGFDVSVMYVHRVSESTLNGTHSVTDELATALISREFRKRDYIEIPVNIKYKFSIPPVGHFLAPYIFTGPSVAVLASKKDITEGYRNRAFDVAWNFGLGVELFSHLQIGASYGMGMTKTVELLNKVIDPPLNEIHIEGKNKYWTITAAWLF